MENYETFITIGILGTLIRYDDYDILILAKEMRKMMKGIFWIMRHSQASLNIWSVGRIFQVHYLP